MKVWILVIIAVALLIWSLVRERFEATPSIKAPPYDAVERGRIFEMARQRDSKPPYQFLGHQDQLLAKARAMYPDVKDEKLLKQNAGGLLVPAIESFFNTVYKPATTPITEADITRFMATRPTTDINDIETSVLKTYFIGQSGAGVSDGAYAAALAELGQNAGYLVSGTGSSSTTDTSAKRSTPQPRSGTGSSMLPQTAITGESVSEDSVTPVCPAGTFLYTQGRGTPKCATSEVTNFTCPAGYIPTASRNCRNPSNPSDTRPPQCPAGKEFNDDMGGCIKPMIEPTCPPNYMLIAGRGDKCIRTGAQPPRAPAPPPPSAPGSTTTGGSSTSTWAPNAGGPTNRLRQVFGPQFTGQDGDLTKNGGDSSQTNVYPELLGGIIDSSSRIPGAGITAPSKNWTLSKNGSLPPKTTMGSDEMSRYFPFSRTPGDMDVIPDPYRVAQTFSASSYASKTEPVPFLTDFSAFQK